MSDTWQLTCYHLILDICYHLVQIHLTWCCDTWLDIITTWYLYYIAYSWLSLLRGLDMIIILLPSSTPKFLYSWTPVLLPVSPVLMSPVLLLLLIEQSYRRPVEYATWCWDDKDVSHDHASFNGSWKELSATPHTWWEATSWICGATSRIHSPHRPKCNATHVVGATSWICGAISGIYFPRKIILPPTCAALC